MSFSNNSCSPSVALTDNELQAIVQQAMATAMNSQVRSGEPILMIAATTSPGFGPVYISQRHPDIS